MLPICAPTYGRSRGQPLPEQPFCCGTRRRIAILRFACRPDAAETAACQEKGRALSLLPTQAGDLRSNLLGKYKEGRKRMETDNILASLGASVQRLNSAASLFERT